MTEDHLVPETEIYQRKARVQEDMKKNGIDGLFIAQRMDLYYFSGTAQNGFLYMPAEGETLLFIKKFMPRAQQETSIHHVFEIKSVKEIPGRMSDFYGGLPAVLGFEFDVLPVKDFQFYCRLFHEQEPVDASPAIHRTRMIKSDWEIAQMEKTADISLKTFAYMKTAIRPGMTEMEFAGIFETYSRKIGHGGRLRARNYQMEAYPWHVLSGKNGGVLGFLDAPTTGQGTSPAFPCGGSSKLLAAHEPIMIDFGTILNGYHLDETRMFAIRSMPEKAMKVCQASIEIHQEILKKLKPGMTVAELFELSISKAKSLGYTENYLGPPGYQVSFIGHGIGLEIIEPPIIARDRKDILLPGMTLAIEPKFVYQDEFAAGIESVFLVTDKGSRLISKVPAEVFIC